MSCGARRKPRTGVGESPSWSRHRILIPTCEGSSPSSPARSKRPSAPRSRRAVQHCPVHRKRQPGARAGHRHAAEHRAGQGKGRPLLRRRGRRRDRAERSRPRHLRPAVDVLADEREPDGALHHGRRAQARLGAQGDGRDPVLRLRPPGSPAEIDAGADQRQGRGQHARGRRRRAAADDGPARRPDPGLLQHSRRQHLRVAGAAVRPAVEALRRPRGGLARRRRRRPRAGAGEAGRAAIWRSSTSAVRRPTCPR